MNGFERHAINHSSASSINLWQNAPDVFIAEKLFGLRGRMSPAALRGIEIEKAIVRVLMRECDIETSIGMAIHSFNLQTALQGGDKIDKERECIDPAVRIGVGELSQYGKPEFAADGKQNRIELLCNGEGWSLPIVGYLDLVYPQHGLVVDIKTTLKAPTEMSDEHQRQAAIYRKASGNSAVKFLYLTPKKAVWHECADVDGTLAEIKTILTRQEHFLRQGSKEELAKLVHFNRGAFYWNGNEENRKAVYGI